jgi:hypothetical protein
MHVSLKACVCVWGNFAFLEECAATQIKVAECIKKMILSGDLKKV